MSYGDDTGAQQDIAIVGMALRVPGARNIQEFWSNLRNGVESIRTLSTDELLAAGERPEKIKQKSYVPRTADLPDMEMFDAEFFGLGPKDAAVMDPQHRHFLECAWEAMESAARPPQTIEGPVGVFAGCGMGSYFYFNVCSHRDLVDQVGMFLLRHTGNDKDFLATRASFAFDLKGPSVNIQTACSTSLVAVHQACQSLLAGECDMALAGGVTIEFPHRRGYLYHDGEILSPDGHCRAFDHRAAGTVFGSGVGVVVLRRLADALRDGDPIRAVIKATAVNNDGASKAGYLAPSVSGQAAAVVEALGLAGIGADAIQYVECHGTGTYLGDPIEIEALTQAYRTSTDRRGYCRVGSVKTNIGHLDTAAGVVSLIKTALALEHGEMPPTLNFEKPNPAIDFANSPFLVNDRLTPWPATSGPRRAAVNSLGVGGTNAHAILEAAPPTSRKRTSQPEVAAPNVIVLSARSRKSLDAAGQRLAAHLASTPELSLTDAAYSLFHGRRHFEHRRVVAVADRTDAIAVLENPEASARRLHTHALVDGETSAVFLLPGGGAQHPAMARTLYRDEPLFKSAVDEGLSYLPPAVSTEIRRLWLDAPHGDPEASRALLLPSLQLPAILIVEVALARLWMAQGLTPAALIGHSMGENAAACIAGVLTFERAVNLVRLRGELFDEIRGGGMLSVSLSHDDLRQRLPASLDIASVNAPELCVVSGTDADLEAFRLDLTSQGIEASRVPIDIAAHSRWLEPILARFEAFLAASRLAPPKIPIVSNLTGTWLTAAEATDPRYWVRHLRSTVRFAEGLATLAADRRRIYIEVGPGRTLSSLTKAQGNIDPNQVINTLPHADDAADDRLHFLAALGRAWATGLPVPLDRLWAGRDARRVPLPTYPFQHQRYFLDRIKPATGSQDEPFEKLADIADWGSAPTWIESVAGMRLHADRTKRSWLVLMDDVGVGQELVDRLRRLGHAVVTVTAGDSNARLAEDAYVLCDEEGRDGYAFLLQSLAQGQGIPTNIIHLGLLTADETCRPGSSFFDRNQERGFYSLFFLGQVLTEVGAPGPVQISVVTNGMQRVGDEPLAYPEKATVLGPALVLPKEATGIQVRVVDVPSPPPGGTLAAKVVRDVLFRAEGDRYVSRTVSTIWADLFAAPATEQVAYRGGQRWLRTYEPARLEARHECGAFRDGGVYLITGGLGDLALEFALRLGCEFAARIALVGRNALPARDTWDDYLARYGAADRIGRAIGTIRRIEAAGGEVLTLAADVANPDAMRSAVEATVRHFGTVNGVLHAAGVVKDDLIAMKSPVDLQEVLAPKVVGTLVLEEALAGFDLDVVVLFSSTSSDTAPAGQVDYVAANAFLNAFAESRTGRLARRVVAIHWGIWKDVGLAARSLAPEDGTMPRTVAATKAMLFDRRITDGQGAEFLEGRWDATRHWILGEHRLISGEAVWPGTGYIEALAEAARDAGITGSFAMEDVTFLRPLPIKDGEARAVRLLTDRHGSGGLRMALVSEFEGQQGVVESRHCEAVVRPIHSSMPKPIDLAQLRAACAVRKLDGKGSALASIQEGHLAFGPRWKVLRSVHFGERRALAQLALDHTFADDFASGIALHPALLDIATGFAMELVPGYDASAALWVPMSYGRLVVYRPLEQEIWSHARLSRENDLGPGYATFDVTITNPAGEVLLVVERFTVKQLPTGFDLRGALAEAQTGEPRQRKGNARAAAESSPALQRLQAQIEQGILPDEGFEAMLRAVGRPEPQVVVSSMDLERLRRASTAIEVAPTAGSSFERPDLDSDYVAPESDVEKVLAGFWSELLGIEKIGVNDSFFDLGGHSLIAVRLFRMIKKEFTVDMPISVLFEAPTIAACARMIEAAGGRSDKPVADSAGKVTDRASTVRPFRHLVPMHGIKDREGRRPFFICAGMFGNILNLRHLALHVGDERPVYGLQARGLYGDEAPHETFEEMATAYLAEVRQVQPHGPYLLGGFSGGGLVAYEMAQQLRAAGEEVGIVIMLDTPFPAEVPLSVVDRVALRTQDIRRRGAGFFADWVKSKLEYKLRQRQQRREEDAVTGEQLHNHAIQQAFCRALTRYRAKAYDGFVLMLRPKLDPRYRLPDGRELTIERSLVRADNGWSPYVADLSVVEVPGNHDSMVLEPNIRVLAAHMVRALDGAQPMHLSIAAE